MAPIHKISLSVAAIIGLSLSSVGCGPSDGKKAPRLRQAHSGKTQPTSTDKTRPPGTPDAPGATAHNRSREGIGQVCDHSAQSIPCHAVLVSFSDEGTQILEGAAGVMEQSQVPWTLQMELTSDGVKEGTYRLAKDETQHQLRVLLITANKDSDLARSHSEVQLITADAELQTTDLMAEVNKLTFNNSDHILILTDNEQLAGSAQMAATVSALKESLRRRTGQKDLLLKPVKTAQELQKMIAEETLFLQSQVLFLSYQMTGLTATAANEALVEVLIDDQILSLEKYDLNRDSAASGILKIQLKDPSIFTKDSFTLKVELIE